MLNDLWRLDMDDDPADCDSGDCVRWERVESDVSKEELGDRPEARTVRASSCEPCCGCCLLSTCLRLVLVGLLMEWRWMLQDASVFSMPDGSTIILSGQGWDGNTVSLSRQPSTRFACARSRASGSDRRAVGLGRRRLRCR